MPNTCLHTMVDAIHRDGSIGNGNALLICHHTLNATVHLQKGGVGAHGDSMSILLPSFALLLCSPGRPTCSMKVSSASLLFSHSRGSSLS